MKVLLICLALYACAEESPQEKVRPGAAMDADMLFTRGTALASEGRHTEAIDAYQQAAALAPKSAKIHYNLGNAYVRQLDYPSAMAPISAYWRWIRHTYRRDTTSRPCGPLQFGPSVHALAAL